MRLAVSNIGWTAEHDQTILPHLRKAGADAIEVAPGRLFSNVADATTSGARSIADFYAREDLPIISMQALLFGRKDLLLFGDDPQAQDLQNYLAHVFKIAGALGCGPLVFGSPANRLKGDMSFEDAAQHAVPVFQALGDIAIEHNTVLCLEANAQAYGCDFINRLSEAGEIARRCNNAGIGIVVDTGNMIMETESTTAASSVADLVNHIHISAPQLGPVLEHADYLKSVLNNLKGAGYSGDVTLEMRPPESSDPVATLIENVSFTRALVDEVFS